jgi:hypothetical protein
VFPRITSAPVPATSSLVSDFTDPAVPTGMKAGVRMVPWSVPNSPVRALALEARILNVPGAGAWFKMDPFLRILVSLPRHPGEGLNVLIDRSASQPVFALWSE